MTSGNKDTAPKPSSLTGGSLLARNTVFNLVGQAAPMLVALFAIPFLIHGLGTDRFGVLTLAWMVIGYFSLFDLGLGRAMTQIISERIGAGKAEDLSTLIWTGLALMAVLGVFGALVVVLLSPWLVHSVLKIPIVLQAETLHSFYLLAASIPIVISTAGLSGILSALQRFDILNMIRIPMGIFSFLGPVLILPISQSLFLVTTVLVIGRIVAWAIHLTMCLRVMPALRSGISLQRSMVRPLLRFGSWMTVTNVVGPLMVYLDRFVIGAVVSVTAVAYYATPYELVTKFWIVPGAVVGVLFPAFAIVYVQDKRRAALLLNRGTKYTFLMLFPITLILVSFAHEGLRMWLGEIFANNSAPVLQWLAVGVFVNSLAQVPFAFIQGVGRPDVTAKLHLLELPIYLFGFWWLVNEYGIVGAAAAWTGRVILDAIVLFALAGHFINGKKTSVKYRILGGVLIAVILVSAATADSLFVRVAFVTLILLVFFPSVWVLMLGPEERISMRSKIKLPI